MNSMGTWIDWQYLLDAANLLKKVGRQHIFSYKYLRNIELLTGLLAQICALDIANLLKKVVRRHIIICASFQAYAWS